MPGCGSSTGRRPKGEGQRLGRTAKSWPHSKSGGIAGLGTHRPPDHYLGWLVMQFFSDFLADALGQDSTMLARLESFGFQDHRLALQVFG